MQRLLRHLRFSHDVCNDVEAKSSSSISENDNSKRLKFMNLLFDIKPEVLENFSGIAAICEYLEEDAFQPLLSPAFALINSPVSGTSLGNTADCWEFILAVLQTLKSEQPGISIHGLSRRIETTWVPEPGQAKDKTHLCMAIFAVLCWSTLRVRPRLMLTDHVTPDTMCLAPVGFDAQFTPTPERKSDKFMRSLVNTFKPFKAQHWGDQSAERAQGGFRVKDSLYQATLNIYVLRYFGKITIQWVDTMSEHLRFNPANRRLSVFRFPTFCALLAIRGKDVCQEIQNVNNDFDPLCPKDRDLCCVSLEQEILLSYRLLFGQDEKSRKLARREISRLQASFPKQKTDTMLSHLCERRYEHGKFWWKTYDKDLQSYPTKIWPITCRNLEDNFQQSDVYSAWDDFPRLGPRLLKLQDFSMRQNPSKLTDLWRDRRNPLQWYTFWAVLVVGGVANILAAFQLAVAIAQLRFPL